MSTKRKVAKKKDTTASVKGRLVEMIVAALHESSEVTVQRNARIPSLRNPKRKREIDILLSGHFSGYPIRIAIECKNYNRIIDVDKIDAYIGKLQQIGVPPQHGVYVSAHGYTSGAIDRAKEVGITPLILTGLTKDRLAAEITSAIQSVVYLLLEITSITIRSDVEEVPSVVFLWFLYDKNQNMVASIPDLVWKMWIEGKLPQSLGEHEIEVDIPKEWQNLIDGKFYPVLLAKVTVAVRALLIHLEGSATQHALINTVEETVDKFQVQTTFNPPTQPLPVRHFRTETSLREYLKQRPEAIKVNLGGFKLPRILFNWMYWPFSLRAYQKFAILARKCYQESRTPTNEEYAEIEGSDLETIWEPIWEDNPILELLD